MYAIFVNWMRTVVPLLVGYLLTAADVIGIHPDTATTAALVTSLLTAGYYTAFRVIEEAADRIDLPAVRVVAGVLLGWARPPQADSAGLRA